MVTVTAGHLGKILHGHIVVTEPVEQHCWATFPKTGRPADVHPMPVCGLQLLFSEGEGRGHLQVGAAKRPAVLGIGICSLVIKLHV